VGVLKTDQRSEDVEESGYEDTVETKTLATPILSRRGRLGIGKPYWGKG